MSGGEKYVYLYSITLLHGCQSVLAHGLRHASTALLGQAAGQNGFRPNEACAADDALAVFFPQIINQVIEPCLFLKIGRFRDVKQAVLPLAAFFLCYAAACAAGGGQGLCIAVSFAGLALGALVMVFIGRRRKAPRYELTGYIR